MITIRLMGGLGNQLFQVVAMWRLQRVLGRAARCDNSLYTDPDDGSDTKRELEVSALLQKSDYTSMQPSLAQLAYSRHNPRRFVERGPEDDLISRLPRRFCWVQGYFQRTNYVLSVPDMLTDRLLPILDTIEPSPGIEGAIGIHIRLGDYYSSPATRVHHGVADASYFSESLKGIGRERPDTPVAVFTDSPEIVKTRYLPSLPDSTRLITRRTAWETLQDLSSCAAIVMSNSSLSWWAATIATVVRGKDVPVVKPVPWFAKTSPADHLLMVPGWVERSRILA
jgi:phosphohistidine swiveling domain-containing protein